MSPVDHFRRAQRHLSPLALLSFHELPRESEGKYGVRPLRPSIRTADWTMSTIACRDRVPNLRQSRSLLLISDKNYQLTRMNKG